MERTTFSNNSATPRGGAISVTADYPAGSRVEACTFLENEALLTNPYSGRGGALSQENGAAEVRRSLFYDNVAGSGGAIHFSQLDSGSIVANCTLHRNRAYDDGGGLRCTASGTVRLNNVTVTANQAHLNLAGSGTGGGVDGTVDVENSVIAENIDHSGTAPNCVGVVSLGHNLLDDDTGCSFTPATGDLVGSAPQLNVLADYGDVARPSPLLSARLRARVHSSPPAASASWRGIAKSVADLRALPM